MKWERRAVSGREGRWRGKGVQGKTMEEKEGYGSGNTINKSVISIRQLITVKVLIYL